MTDRPLIFLDTETLGLEVWRPIWEIAVIRREIDGTEAEHLWQLRYEPGFPLGSHRRPLRVTDADPDLPAEFLADFEARYDPDAALLPAATRDRLRALLDGQPTLIGAVPNFDTERITHQLGVTGWHHRLRCVETLTAGHLGYDPGGLGACADTLGINHPHDHTALGDTRTAKAIWDRIIAGARP